MGSEKYVIINPSDNNRDLRISTVSQDGRVIELARLKPGKSYRPEKKSIMVDEVPRRGHVLLDVFPDDRGVHVVPEK